MRVTLVIPPSGFLLDERVFPSLGILKVAASLEHAGHAVDVCDLSGVQAIEEQLYVYTSLSTADVYGVTATMPQMPAAARILRWLRKECPQARLILGGPHPTLVYASARQHVSRAERMLGELMALADSVVVGDGEKAVHVAIRPDAPALVDAESPTTTLFLTKRDLEDGPLPARHLIDIRSYKYQIDGLPTMSMIAQLGCPFGCAFCGGRRSPFLRRVRTRSTDQVIAEMRHLCETYGTRGFMFLDDELNVNKQFSELLQAMIAEQERLGTTFRLRGLLKSELVTEDMAGLMYRAGFREVLIGFESGSDRMLLNMQKGCTGADNTECVRRLKSAGIRVKALMSFGHPGESLETVEDTRDWLLDVEPSDFDVTIITVYPGTPYFDDAVSDSGGIWTYTAPRTSDRLYSRDVNHLRDVNFYKGVPGAYQSFVFTDDLTADALVTCRDQVEREVRAELGLKYPQSAAERNYEHSMGMNA